MRCFYGIAAGLTTNDSISLRKNSGHCIHTRPNESLLSDPVIDAVYIPLPNSLHAEWVKKAAAAKKHVLCEKPLGVNASEVADMQAACDANGVLLMEAFAYRHSPLTRTIESLVQSGQIGDIRLIEAYFCYNLQDLDNVRLQSDLKGGATYDVGCYNIDLIGHLMGSLPDSVQASAFIGPDSQVDESCLATFTFPGAVDAISYCSFRTEARNECTILGSEGILSVSPAFNFQGTSKIKLTIKGQPDTIIVDCPNNYSLEIEQFGRCITDGEQPLLSHESSRLTAQIMDRVLAQIYTQPVTGQTQRN